MRLFFLLIVFFCIAAQVKADITIPIPIGKMTQIKYSVGERADLFTGIFMQDARAQVVLNANGKYNVCIRLWIEDTYLQKKSIDSIVALVNDCKPLVKGLIAPDSAKYIDQLYFELVGHNGKLYKVVTLDLDRIGTPTTVGDKLVSVVNIYRTLAGYSYNDGQMNVELTRSFVYPTDTATYFHDLAYNYVRVMNVYVLGYDSIVNLHFYGFPSGTSINNAYRLLFKINKDRVVVCREYVMTNLMIFIVGGIFVSAISFFMWYFINRSRMRKTRMEYMENTKHLDYVRNY